MTDDSTKRADDDGAPTRRGARTERRATRRAKRGERRDARRGARSARRDARDGGETRRRRSPEVARQELLDAAERVFGTHAPDQVGLKEVAREAGVSHALITHYFGTYAGLVEATLHRRLTELRETMIKRLAVSGALSRPEELLAILSETFEDPVHLRLMKWVVGTERPAAIHALALQEHGLQIVAQHVAAALVSQHVARLPDGSAPTATPQLIETVEMTLVAAVAATLGYAIAKYALAGGAGREVGPALDDAVRATLAGMVRSYLADRLAGIGRP